MEETKTSENWQLEYIKELKSNVYELKHDFQKTREDINHTLIQALGELRHLDNQRHTEYLSINKKSDDHIVEINKRLDDIIHSTGRKMDNLRYWVVGTGIGIISIMLSILKLIK